MKFVVIPITAMIPTVPTADQEDAVGATPEQTAHVGNEHTAEDLRTGEHRGREAGHAVRIRVAVQLEQIRLARIEGEEGHATREGPAEHQGADRRVAPAGVDRAAQDVPDLGDRDRRRAAA